MPVFLRYNGGDVLEGEQSPASSASTSPSPKPTLVQFCATLRDRLSELGKTVDDIPTVVVAATQPVSVDGDTFISEDPLDLSIATVQHITQGSRTALQQSEVKKWWDERINANVDISGNWSERNLFRLIDLFSDMFFLKPIPALNTGVGVQWDPNLISARQAIGLTTHERNPQKGRGDRIVMIKLDPRLAQITQGLSSCQASICSTLLHEMIHAYLLSYSCDGYHDNRGGCTRKGRPLWPYTAHDLAWFHIACAIEIHMELRTGIELNLGCFRSYVADCKNGGTLLFAPEWRRFFNMAWKDCCKLFDRLEVEEQNDLRSYLEINTDVMALWAGMGESNSSGEDGGSGGSGGSNGSGGSAGSAGNGESGGESSKNADSGKSGGESSKNAGSGESDGKGGGEENDDNADAGGGDGGKGIGKDDKKRKRAEEDNLPTSNVRSKLNQETV